MQVLGKILSSSTERLLWQLWDVGDCGRVGDAATGRPKPSPWGTHPLQQQGGNFPQQKKSASFLFGILLGRQSSAHTAAAPEETGTHSDMDNSGYICSLGCAKMGCAKSQQQSWLRQRCRGFPPSHHVSSPRLHTHLPGVTSAPQITPPPLLSTRPLLLCKRVGMLPGEALPARQLPSAVVSLPAEQGSGPSSNCCSQHINKEKRAGRRNWECSDGYRGYPRRGQHQLEADRRV